MTLISFIIPTINRDTLDSAVQSLLDQSNSNWKAIIIGDHITPHKFNDPRINTAIYLENIPGAGAVRNAALDLVETEWVGFLDDDDILMPGYVDLVYEHSDSADAIVFKMDNYGNILPIDNIIRFGNIGMSFALRTPVCKEIRFQGAECGEDFRMMESVAAGSHRIIFLEEIGYVVRPHVARGVV